MQVVKFAFFQDDHSTETVVEVSKRQAMLRCWSASKRQAFFAKFKTEIIFAESCVPSDASRAIKRWRRAGWICVFALRRATFQRQLEKLWLEEVLVRDRRLLEEMLVG